MVVAYAANEPGPEYEDQQRNYNIAASQIAIIAGIMYTGAVIASRLLGRSCLKPEVLFAIAACSAAGGAELACLIPEANMLLAKSEDHVHNMSICVLTDCNSETYLFSLHCRRGRAAAGVADALPVACRHLGLHDWRLHHHRHVPSQVPPG